MDVELGYGRLLNYPLRECSMRPPKQEASSHSADPIQIENANQPLDVRRVAKALTKANKVAICLPEYPTNVEFPSFVPPNFPIVYQPRSG